MVIDSYDYGYRRFFNLGWRNFIIFIVVFVFLLVVYSIAFGYNNCDSWDCFNDNLEKCSRTKFIGESDMLFEYIIRGISDGSCEVEVRLLRSNLNNIDSEKIDGLSMTCSLPKGVVIIPESDIDACHGLLKEGLQDLMIEKLHGYLVQNLGKINLEMIE